MLTHPASILRPILMRPVPDGGLVAQEGGLHIKSKSFYSE